MQIKPYTTSTIIMLKVAPHTFITKHSHDAATAMATNSCHPFMALPPELRLLIWETYGEETRVFEYKEDTGLIRLSREYRHPRQVGLSVCGESRAAIQALMKPFEHPHDIEKRSQTSDMAAAATAAALLPPAPAPVLRYVPARDIFYLPPPVYRSRIHAWESLWTTKAGIRNVGVHWSVMHDERRIAEALGACGRCFTDMRTLVVFIEFKPLPAPKEEEEEEVVVNEDERGEEGERAKAAAAVSRKKIVRLVGPAEDGFPLPSRYSSTHGLLDDFWNWGEMRRAIEKVRRGVKGAPEVEAVLFSREVEVEEAEGGTDIEF